MSFCSVCGEAAEPGLSITHRKCLHATHAACIVDDAIDFKTCPRCLGQAVAGAPREPRTTDGIDYVLNPGAPPQKPGIIGRLLSVRQQPAAAPTPLQLLEQRVPLLDAIRVHGYGLDHMLRAGINIDHFIDNGYGLEDVAIYEDVSRKSAHRAQQALTIGLGLTAAHVREHPDRFPIERVRELFGNTSALETCSVLGLAFEDDGPLACFGDDQWTAADCVKLGLCAEDLLELGMTRIEQYEDLMGGLTERQQERAERALKVTPEHIKRLLPPPPPPPAREEPPRAPREEPRRAQSAREEPREQPRRAQPAREEPREEQSESRAAPRPAVAPRMEERAAHARLFVRHGYKAK
jgi:hypothetical protein